MGTRYIKPSASVAVSGIALIAALLLTGYVEEPTILDQVKHTGKLVVATRNNPTTYYEGPLGPTGFEYDLATKFADYLGVELKIVTPENFGDIIPMIIRRDVHLAAAGLTITDERKQLISFGPAYQEITQQLVYRKSRGVPTPKNLYDLQNGKIEVVAGSSHAEQLRLLESQNFKLNWMENQSSSTADLLANVWNRKLDYTVADSNEITMNQRYYPELRVAFDLTSAEQLAWAFYKGRDDSLLKAAQQFFDKIKTNGQLAQLVERHYGHVKKFDYVGTRTFLRHINRRLPEYQKIFETAANRYNLDWRLLAAMGYQESHWDPKAVSPTGVKGIMMLTRVTARDLGIHNRIDPSNSIVGGARYFQLLMGRIPADIKNPDRTWMALAAYNIGYGHLEDARIITQRSGGDPDNWMDVKKALPLLMNKSTYKKTRHGYARGREAVLYVENIRSYYDMLTRQTSPRPLPESQLTKQVKYTHSAQTISSPVL